MKNKIIFMISIAIIIGISISLISFSMSYSKLRKEIKEYKIIKTLNHKKILFDICGDGTCAKNEIGSCCIDCGCKNSERCNPYNNLCEKKINFNITQISEILTIKEENIKNISSVFIDGEQYLKVEIINNYGMYETYFIDENGVSYRIQDLI